MIQPVTSPADGHVGGAGAATATSTPLSAHRMPPGGAPFFALLHSNVWPTSI